MASAAAAPAALIDAPIDHRSAVINRYRTRLPIYPEPRPALVLGDGLYCCIGRARLPALVRHDNIVVLSFDHVDGDAIVSVANVLRDTDMPAAALIVVATNEQCQRVFGFVPKPGRWHMSADLRVIATAIGGGKIDLARELYLRAKSLELACVTLEYLRAESLTPFGACATLSESDTRRILAARTLIEERLREPLILGRIARECGLNRTKLSRGFRELFGTTVATFISDMRMRYARTLLLTTDLKIGIVGFRSGFENNASFARAFARHYGCSPTEMRDTATR